MATLVSIVIALVIIGVFVWGARKLIALVPMEPWIAQVVDVIIVVGAVIAVVLYVVVPLLTMLGGAMGGVHMPSIK